MRLRKKTAPADTRDTIKRTARRLFAERGIDGVSVKEIVIAAGQRNGGSLHYHFRTKESLVRELLSDGAKQIDHLRNTQLDKLESGDRTPTLREVIEILVLPSNSGQDVGIEDTFLRFITILQLSHRHIFLDVIENHWNLGYLRCLGHIRNLLRSVVPNPILHQRLVFMGIYLNAVMSAREGALDLNHGQHHFWSSPYTLDNFMDSIEQLLRAPASFQTQRHLPKVNGRTQARQESIAAVAPKKKAIRTRKAS